MRVGDRVAHYELLEELGHGGMGAVFRSKDLNTGQEVALKILPPELSLSPALLQRFRREVMTLRQLHHPSIVRILDVGAEDRTNYFAMDYVGGGSLQRLLEREGGRLDVERSIDITLQLAEALDYAHAKNIIHRDIKPSNVLLTEGGHPKLTDFGIAKVVEATRMTVTGGIVGTVDYMAPEQAEGRAIGAKTDIYSLGVLLYQMTTGRLPFKGETPSEVIQKHRFSLVEPPINFNPDMPENLSLVIEHMLEKEPAKRVASMRQLIKVLQKLKSQMHPSDPAKRPTVYNVEGFVTPPDRDTSVQAASAAAPSSQPTPVPAPVAPPRRRWGRPSYQQAPDWASRLWLLLGILLILAIVSLPGYKLISRILTRPLPASVLLEQGLDAERRGDYAGARAAYRGLASKYPDSAEAESALEGLRRITLMTQWGMFLKRYQLDVRDLEQMGRLDAAQDLLSFIERHWPEQKEWVERQRTRLSEMKSERETRLYPAGGESEGESP